jgi:carbon storage regulator
MEAHMLVLRRRAGEGIILGGGIEIEVIELSRTRVKLGVKAPRDLIVLRREAAAVASENRNALGLLLRRGAAADGDLLRLLETLSVPLTQTTALNADM